MKKCDKCSSQLEPNYADGLINYQTIVLYDTLIDLCNDCSSAVFKFATGKFPLEENPVEMDEELFD